MVIRLLYTIRSSPGQLVIFCVTESYIHYHIPTVIMEPIHYPWMIRDVEPDLTSELIKYFTNEQTSYVRVGPKGYFFPGTFKNEAAKIYNLKIRSEDVFVASIPRSGSTLIRELVWIVANDWNLAKSKTMPLDERFLFLERYALVHPVMKKRVIQETKHESKIKLLDVVIPEKNFLADAQSPRFIMTHLPLSLLPPSLLSTGKVVYIARDPRDVAVSFYHLNRLQGLYYAFNGDFKKFWTFFIRSAVFWTPYFESVKEFWAMRDQPNMLFLFYEDVCKCLPSAIHKVASFLKKTCSDEQVACLCEHLNINNFRTNKAVNYNIFNELGVLKEGEQPYIRKGKSGGWREYFDEEMTQQAEQWMADNLRDTDLRFPDM